MFDDRPAAPRIAGAIVLVASGLYLLWSSGGAVATAVAFNHAGRQTRATLTAIHHYTTTRSGTREVYRYEYRFVAEGRTYYGRTAEHATDDLRLGTTIPITYLAWNPALNTGRSADQALYDTDLWSTFPLALILLLAAAWVAGKK